MQGEVDEARSLMHGTLESMLQNQEQLTSRRARRTRSPARPRASTATCARGGGCSEDYLPAHHDWRRRRAVFVALWRLDLWRRRAGDEAAYSVVAAAAVAAGVGDLLARECY